jgi:predicted RNA-binding Zn ribbon-like protein
MDAAELPLVGGHVALDLANTLDWDEARRDYLQSYDDLVEWFSRTPLVSAADAHAARSISAKDGDRALARIVELRAALRAILLAQLGVAEWDQPDVVAALELTSRRNAEAYGRATLEPASPGEALVRHVGSAPARLIEDRLAIAVFDVLTEPELHRLRRCPIDEGGCGWMFLDRSKNSSRTWCRMEDCGNQAKSRRLTERRRKSREEHRSEVTL